MISICLTLVYNTVIESSFIVYINYTIYWNNFISIRIDVQFTNKVQELYSMV